MSDEDFFDYKSSNSRKSEKSNELHNRLKWLPKGAKQNTDLPKISNKPGFKRCGSWTMNME